MRFNDEDRGRMPGRSSSMCIIDDLPRIEMLIVQTVETGIELIQARRPDVVLMDINLPGMSGIEARRKLAEHPETRGIPVVGLSSPTAAFCSTSCASAPRR